MNFDVVLQVVVPIYFITLISHFQMLFTNIDIVFFHKLMMKCLVAKMYLNAMHRYLVAVIFISNWTQQ